MRRLAGTALTAASVACSAGPTTVVLPELEVLVASGDGQYGTASQTLQIPVQVIVRAVATQVPRSGMNVLWSIEEGDASIVGIANTVTDSTGSTDVRVRLGTQTGEITVRAAVQDQDRAFATFRLFMVDRPVLDGLMPESAAPGGLITLDGVNFSPDPEQNVVLFSGVRGVVSAASSTQLTVEVPPCLPARDVAVTVQLGTVGSGSRTLTVEVGGAIHSMAVGEVLDATDDAGFGCFTLPGDGSATYLAMVYSASTVGAGSHPYQLTGLAVPSPFEAAGPFATAPEARVGPSPGRDEQSRWDEFLRTREADLVRDRILPSVVPRPLRVDAPALAPTVGERRTFKVFQSSGGFAEVSAVAQYVGAQAAFFVDEDAPAGGYTSADLRLFSDRFDDVIHPSVTGAFGVASDLDNNDRVVILFTSAVNSLTPRGATGFVAGFFFGLDLMPEQDDSNKAEIFYGLVPDPSGTLSDPRPRAGLLEIMPAILAHEYQHMVHFNERVLVRGAASTEALWLSEGLAQYAEELVALEYESLGDAGSVEVFRDGTRERARRYLAGTASVALIVSTGQGSLAERGASFLHVMYLADRFGMDLIGRVTRTTRTSVGNVEAETGTTWPTLLADWWSAVFVDGPGSETGPIVYPGVDLREFLGDPFPLAPTELGSGDFSRSGSLGSSSIGYYIVSPSAGGSMTLRLGGEAGGVSAPQAVLRMRIIRVQ